MKRFSYLTVLLVLLCFSCKNIAQSNVSTAYLAEVNPKILATYKQQQHRFSIDFCKLYYNEKQVILDSVHKFKKMFGYNYHNENDLYYSDVPLFSKIGRESYEDTTWYAKDVTILLNKNPRFQENINKGFNSLNDKRDSLIAKTPLLKGYIMIDGILVDGNTKIEDFNAIREKEKLPLFTQSGGDIRSQGIIYDVSYCKAIPELSDTYGYTEVFFLYNQEDEFEKTHRRTNIFQFRYNYSYTHPKRN